jgi:hypothetical protein
MFEIWYSGWYLGVEEWNDLGSNLGYIITKIYVICTGQLVLFYVRGYDWLKIMGRKGISIRFWWLNLWRNFNVQDAEWNGSITLRYVSRWAVNIRGKCNFLKIVSDGELWYEQFWASKIRFHTLSYSVSTHLYWRRKHISSIHWPTVENWQTVQCSAYCVQPGNLRSEHSRRFCIRMLFRS